MQKLSSEMKSCIDACQRCYATCLWTAMQHCLQMGGPHTEPKHFQLMMACVEVCRTSAALMLIGSPSHRMQCELCAKICEECAGDCERIGGMEECVKACRACARECRQMAGHEGGLASGRRLERVSFRPVLALQTPAPVIMVRRTMTGDGHNGRAEAQS